MSEFKIPPYMYWYPSDWLTDSEVRRLPEGPKAFYIDLLCQLHLTFPYGYCSLPNPVKTFKLQKQLNQKANQEVNLRVELLLSLSVRDQLKFAENIEGELDKYLPYDQAKIQAYIKVLEDRGIVSRSSDGILYARRMVKDFKKRVTAYLNGSKGGHPSLKRKKKAQKSSVKTVDKILNHKKLRGQVNQTGNQGGYSTADLHNNTINNSVGREGPAAEKPIFQLQKIYDSSFEQLQELRYSKTLTEEGFLEWKKFVDFIVEKNYNDLFITKFVDPPSFETLWRKGFTHNETDPARDKWTLTLEKILGSGVNQTQNLYYRIPQFLGYIKKNNKELFELTTNDESYQFNPQSKT